MSNPTTELSSKLVDTINSMLSMYILESKEFEYSCLREITAGSICNPVRVM